MKATLILAALTVSMASALSASAQTAPVAAASASAPAPASRDFATRKADMAKHIETRMAALTTMRDCVNAANSAADLKVCHQQAHAGRRHGRAPD